MTPPQRPNRLPMTAARRAARTPTPITTDGNVTLVPEPMFGITITFDALAEEPRPERPRRTPSSSPFSTASGFAGAKYLSPVENSKMYQRGARKKIASAITAGPISQKVVSPCPTRARPARRTRTLTSTGRPVSTFDATNASYGVRIVVPETPVVGGAAAHPRQPCWIRWRRRTP